VGRRPAFSREHDFPRIHFRGCSYFFMFRPPRLLAPQIAPTAANIPAGRPRLLRPSRTCVVAFARIGYTIRLTTGNWRNEDFHLARFSALSAAPYLCESFPECLGPCHGGTVECTCLFLPPRHRPSPVHYRGRLPACARQTISRRIAFSRLQPFLYVQALRFARLPDRSYRCGLSPQGSRGFYIRAEHASLPPHASDMLTTRPGNWWCGDLHPTRFTALSAAPVVTRCYAT
jgi:hypothetical protein